jgi:hypothetical protein
MATDHFQVAAVVIASEYPMRRSKNAAYHCDLLFEAIWPMTSLVPGPGVGCVLAEGPGEFLIIRWNYTHNGWRING